MSNANHWQQVQQLFDELVQLNAEHQSARLQELQQDNATLYQDVIKLLRSDAEAKLETLPRSQVALSELEPQPELGTRIGPFKLTGQLGSGGMGHVYLAERDDAEFNKTVAIKVLQRGIDTQRFQIERQILAKLEHPNIARLLDGGRLPDGRPYVVMEYVDGKPIDQYCLENKLNLKQRIILFKQLCTAVQHAHRNLIVHRDLKPGNILVDEEGQVKLLDFGIAKLLGNADENGMPSITQTAAQMMTPGYASPEQLQGQPINTSSDIYSLGVVLYELLCGARPYQQYEHSRKSFEEAVLNRLPINPSQLVSTTQNNADHATRITEGFGTTTDRLARQLKGDLDNILLKTLNAKPDHRYPSVLGLTDDLERYLKGHPVEARAAGTIYKASKFVQRHWIGATASLIVIAVASFQQFRVIQEKNVATIERDIANETSDFLIGIFENADPNNSRRDAVTVREILDIGTNNIEIRTDFPREVKYKLLIVMGAAYRSLGVFDRSEELLTRAKAITDTMFGEESLETAHVIKQMAVLARTSRDLDNAEALARKDIELHKKALGNFHIDVAQGLGNLGVILSYRGRFEEAKSSLLESIEIQEQLNEKDEKQLAESYSDLGVVLRNLSDLEHSHSYLQSAIAILEKNKDSPLLYAQTLNNLAITENDLDYIDAAVDTQNKALNIFSQLLGDSNPLYGRAQSNMATYLNKQGKPLEALKHATKSLEISRQSGSASDIASDAAAIANQHYSLGNYIEAIKLFEESVTIFKGELGTEHNIIAVLLNNLAQCYKEHGNLEKAMSLSLEALQIHETNSGSQGLSYGTALIGLSHLLSDMGQSEQALVRAEQSLAILKDHISQDHTYFGYGVLALTRAQTELRMSELAKKSASKAIDIFKDKPAPRQTDYYRARAMLGRTYIYTEEFEKAEQLLLESYNYLSSDKSLRKRLVNESLDYLVELYSTWGNEDKAKQFSQLKTGSISNKRQTH